MVNSSPENAPHVPGPEEGFDRAEPKAAFIAVFGVAVLVVLAVVIFALQAWYDRVYEQQVFIKVLDPVSEDLRNLRAKEDAMLHSYQYIDRARGVVRLPIDRAMELLAQEYAEGRLKYPTKPMPVKSEPPPTPAVGQGASNAK